MAAYTAADVKALREKTGAGMLDCKNALVETDGDVEKAIELLRIKGQKGVAKRADRDASNGLVAVHVDGGLGVMVQVNCETDFVAKSEGFVTLANQVLAQAVAVGATDSASLLALSRRCSAISRSARASCHSLCWPVSAIVSASRWASSSARARPTAPQSLGRRLREGEAG